MIESFPPRRKSHCMAHPLDNPDARSLILAHGRNSTCYQLLNPGIAPWFSRAGDAVAGHVRRGSVWLIAGEPVCPADRLPAVVAELEAAAAADGCRACFVLAEHPLRAILKRDPGHSCVGLGAQPAWNPADWPSLVAAERSIRSQLNRAKNKAVEVRFRPAADAPKVRPVLDAWLADRPMPPMHFLVEPDTLSGELRDRLLFVAHHRGAAVAFLLASPVPLRNGYLLEQIARTRAAPNGTAELLIDAAMNHLCGAGNTFATLGLVALAEHARRSMSRNPRWMRLMMGWGRAHGRRFYNFEGLERFRTKLHPRRWEPVYAISNERRFTFSTLHALGSAFSDGPPELLLARAAARAARQEVRWLGERAGL